VVHTEGEEWSIVVERRAWGRFYGSPAGFLIDGSVIADSPREVWNEFIRHHDAVSDRFDRIYHLQKYEFGEIHSLREAARLKLRKIEREKGLDSDAYARARAKYESEISGLEAREQELTRRMRELREENDRFEIEMTTIDGQEVTLPLAGIVRAYPANQLGFLDKLGVYVSRWVEFLTDDPREANSEGGVMPAIVGTVIMTLLMSLAVVPFGVLAALYLREYAKAGPVVSAVRIAINNLAGVPSIVFGVFGLGFFCYIVGVSIDQLFFAERLPNPTYGKGGVIWASLTLALLTLPVVVVATEEALAAVPRSMREGSYACGASKWQTVQRIVLPRAMPGIMTGLILAMARGAGEVAPLMLVGAVKLAPDLPIDGVAPYLHPERSFMHLGFHIYDVGFQSQNSEAAKPMVFTTTLLLITIIAALNVTAIWIRTRLRKRFLGAQF
jgi:phosphate transport system permease protein